MKYQYKSKKEYSTLNKNKVSALQKEREAKAAEFNYLQEKNKQENDLKKQMEKEKQEFDYKMKQLEYENNKNMKNLEKDESKR